MTLIRKLSVMLMLFSLSGCGGGGGTIAIREVLGLATLSGTAAGGAAIVGTVQVTDSSTPPKTKGAPIDADGKYTVDVAGMTSPFILKASGTVGNTTVTYYSAAVLADVGNTVNVTPFTDIMIANISSQMTQDCFADMSKPCINLKDTLTPENLAKAQTDLHNKLLPVLRSLGLSDSIDLLRSSFAANHDGLDAALDLIKVEPDLVSKQTVLKNAITNDVLSTIKPNDPQTHTKPIDAASFDGIDKKAINDLQAIQTTIKRLESLFSKLPPTGPQLIDSGAFDAVNYLDSGDNFDLWATRLSTQKELIGLKIKNIQIEFDKNIPETKAKVFFKIYDKTETYSEMIETSLVKNSGLWKIIGNQKIVDIDFYARSDYFQDLSSFSSGIYLGINAFHYNNRLDATERSSKAVFYAEISGPGLKDAVRNKKTLVLQEDNFGIKFVSQQINECLTSSQMPICVDLSEVKPYSEYTLILKNRDQVILNGAGYKIKIPAVPLTALQLNASMFQQIDHISVDGVNDNPSLFKPNTLLTVFYKNSDKLRPTGLDAVAWFESGSQYLRLEKKVLNPNATSMLFAWEDSLYSERVASLGISARGVDASMRRFYTWRNFSKPLSELNTATYVLGPDELLNNFYERTSSVPKGWWSVDDDVSIYLNGTPLFQDDNVQTDAFEPITFQAKPGDKLRIVAKDSAGSCRYFTPLKLTKSSTSVSLENTSVNQVCNGAAPSSTPFFDQTFTLTTDLATPNELVSFILGPDVLPAGFYAIPSLTPSGWWSVDDDITIYLNDEIIFNDENILTDAFPPVIFQGKAGDRLRIVAKDTAGSCHYLTPLKISKPSVIKKLTETYIKQTCNGYPPSNTPFLDVTYDLP